MGGMMPGAQRKKRVASTFPMKIFPNVISGVVEDQTKHIFWGSMEILVAKILFHWEDKG